MRQRTCFVRLLALARKVSHAILTAWCCKQIIRRSIITFNNIFFLKNNQTINTSINHCIINHTNSFISVSVEMLSPTENSHKKNKFPYSILTKSLFMLRFMETMEMVGSNFVP